MKEIRGKLVGAGEKKKNQCRRFFSCPPTFPIGPMSKNIEKANMMLEKVKLSIGLRTQTYFLLSLVPKASDSRKYISRRSQAS